MNKQNITKKDVEKVLKNVFDPELGINIVDLGLIYQIKIDKKRKNIKVLMTLTSITCPFNTFLIKQTEEALTNLKFGKVDLQLTFDPPWNPKMMSSNLRKKFKL
ncbi:MAG: metal-sulfur cluster assembly factor [Minisyncoccia bacterium]|jgi:metal-sulfur cluster biosynthetic enzyme